MSVSRDGLLVVIEGIDGAGTTTQIERYASHLRERSRLVHVTRQPSRGPIGALIRQALGGRLSIGSDHEAATMALLFAADRLDHLSTEVEPWLRDGAVVLCDRYDLSSLAYQAATASSKLVVADFESWIRTLNRYARRPDLTLVVDVHPDVAERRRAQRSGQPELYEVRELQARLAELYRDAERLCPGDRMVHIDGDGSLDEVAVAIRAALDPFVFA